MGEAKTKEIKEILKALKIKTKALFVANLKDEFLVRASRNIPFFKIVEPRQVSAYDVLKYTKIIITKPALKDLISRF